MGKKTTVIALQEDGITSGRGQLHYNLPRAILDTSPSWLSVQMAPIDYESLPCLSYGCG